ncbi:MAG: hypothetical protein V4480_00130 [Patescibacteria group bacterium]
MNRTTIFVILVLVVVLAFLAVFYLKPLSIAAGTATSTAPAALPIKTTTATTATTSSANLGTYAYECDEHVIFLMTPAADMSTLKIAPLTGAYPPSSTLIRKTSSSGVRYEGKGVIFTAHGETVTLGEGDSAINCSPVGNPDSAPFNFGD